MIPVPTRRIISRLGIAVCLLCLIANVYASARPGFHQWLLGCAGFALEITGIISFLCYLRATERQS